MIGILKKIFSKKNKKQMDTERLISLKENFTGQNFQWVKTTDATRLGKVVKCRDIKPQGRGFAAIFNDGSSISTDLLNRNLMMITEGMQPLSKAEVQAIAGPPTPPRTEPVQNQTGPTGSGPIQMPDDLKQFQTPQSERRVEKQTFPQQEPAAQSFAKQPDTGAMFSMFNTEETNLNISMDIKLPNKKLLKMMYENADDKEVFLTDLSQYVYSKINKDIVKDSLEKTLVPMSRKNNTNAKKTTEVIATEVKEDNE